MSESVPMIVVKHTAKQIETLGYQAGDRVHLRAFLPEKGKDAGRKDVFVYPDIPTELLGQWQQEGRGIYLVVNPGGDTDADISECRAVFYEHDDLDKDISRELWQTLGLPEPTMQVDTGGKSIHTYWVLDESIAPAEWRKLQSDLLIYSDGDRKLKNPSRVMRLAGCIHSGTGGRSLITGGCGKRYRYDLLREIVPAAVEQPTASTKKGVTWADFNRDWRFPIQDAVPLEVCISPNNRKLIESGESQNSRNDSGFKLASDLLATSAYLMQAGQRFSGDPYELFIEYCQRCPSGGGWNGSEWELVWKSAQSKSRNPALSPEQIEGCVKGWAWQNCPDRSLDKEAEKIGRSIPPANIIQFPASSPEATEEDKLRQAIAHYNFILDTGNRFQQIPMRRALAREWGLSVGEIDELSRELSRGRSGEPESMADLTSDLFSEIEARSSGALDPGIQTGFYDLDFMTQGFQRSDLVILAARPSIGKTSLALNFARNVAAQGQPVVIFSLEMSKSQLAYRLLSSESGIPSGRLRSGRIADAEWVELGNAITTLAHLPIYIDDTPAVSVSEVQKKVRRLAVEQGQLGMVLLDYLQLMDGSTDDRVAALDKATRDLKSVARDFNVPTIALSQLSRSVESRTNKRPIMSDLRDSGGIEQNADLVMMLYREAYYNPETSEQGVAELNLVKHRNGPVGTIKFLFEPDFARFRNLARRSA